VEQLLKSMATSLATFGLWEDHLGRRLAGRTPSDLRKCESRCATPVDRRHFVFG
jgi:hypothetical protein